MSSSSEVLGRQCTYELERTSVVGDEEQYQIPTIAAGGWEIFSGTAMKKYTGAMELYWFAATALGMSARKTVGGGEREWIAAARGHRLPVAGIG